eukprot:c20762_g1_i1 orf=225-497(-)
MANINVDVEGEFASFYVTNIDKHRLVFSRLLKMLQRNNVDVLQADVAYDDSSASFSIQAEIRNPSQIASGRLQRHLISLMRAELGEADDD